MDWNNSSLRLWDMANLTSQVVVHSSQVLSDQSQSVVDKFGAGAEKSSRYANFSCNEAVSYRCRSSSTLLFV